MAGNYGKENKMIGLYSFHESKSCLYPRCYNWVGIGVFIFRLRTAMCLDLTGKKLSRQLMLHCWIFQVLYRLLPAMKAGKSQGHYQWDQAWNSPDHEDNNSMSQTLWNTIFTWKKRMSPKIVHNPLSATGEYVAVDMLFIYLTNSGQWVSNS